MWQGPSRCYPQEICCLSKDKHVCRLVFSLTVPSRTPLGPLGTPCAWLVPRRWDDASVPRTAREWGRSKIAPGVFLKTLKRDDEFIWRYCVIGRPSALLVQLPYCRALASRACYHQALPIGCFERFTRLLRRYGVNPSSELASATASPLNVDVELQCINKLGP